jgi:hypothetical protein
MCGCARAADCGIFLFRAKIMDGVSGEMRGLQYRKFRPEESVERAPLLWWRYAINSLVSGNSHMPFLVFGVSNIVKDFCKLPAFVYSFQIL